MQLTSFGLALSLISCLGLAACGGDDAKSARGSNEIPDDQVLPPAPPPAQLPVSSTQNAAMTFKAKRDTQMTAIEVFVARLAGQGSNDIVLTLQRTTSAGAPDAGATLAAATFSSSQTTPNFGWVRVALPSPVPITAGQSFAVSLRAAGQASVKWGATNSDVYADGGAFIATTPTGPWEPAPPPTHDLGFRSLVLAGP